MTKILIVILIIIIMIILFNNKEKFTKDNTKQNKNNIINDIINNINDFNELNLDRLRIKYKWIDPIMYEDIRQLIRHRQCNRENLSNKIFI
jgi:hypothetical protein